MANMTENLDSSVLLENCFGDIPVSGPLDHFLEKLTLEGFDPPTRSIYFFWVDRFIVQNRDITRETMEKFVKKMVDGKFINSYEVYDFHESQYLLVCKFSLNLYEVVFFLPDLSGYLEGKKYFMRIKGKIDLVSLRKLFKVFRINLF